MKVLIWDKGLTLSNSGGPIGYMYNIHEYLKTHPSNQIFFYSDICKDVIDENIKKKKPYIFELFLNLWKTKIISFVVFLYRCYHKKNSISDSDKKLLDQYDYVHIHILPTLISFFSHSDYVAKVIYTTHFPEPLVDEKANSFSVSWLLKLFPFVRNYYIKKECDAIKSCNKVMLPAKEVIEAYISKSKLYKNLFNVISSNLFYVPTAIYPSTPIITGNRELLSDHNIPEESLKICFIGRHNIIKGYDRLKEIAIETWKKIPTAYFVIGGNPGPITELKDKRWIELGWVNTFELLNSIDVFILPNKQTFFDLILIEVLRQQKPCLISYTGGNKWFVNKKWPGIRSFDYSNTSEAVSNLIEFALLKRNGTLEKLGMDNYIHYLEYFTVDKYLDSYIRQLDFFSNISKL